MHNRKLFPPLPDFVKDDPRALAWRVDRIEDHLEGTSRPLNSASLLPFALMALTWMLSLAGLISQEYAAQVIKGLLSLAVRLLPGA